MKFEEQSLQSLRDLAKSKKGHPGLKGFSTMKKGELASALKKNFKVVGGALEEKSGRCWEGYKPVAGKRPYSKGSCKKAEGGSITHHANRLIEAIRKIKSLRSGSGGQISENVKEMAKNIDVAGTGVDGEDDIDFDELKWGKFTDQLDRYNSQNKKKLDLCQFADLILANPKKYSVTTQRRARFYKNVLAKKKCS